MLKKKRGQFLQQVASEPVEFWTEELDNEKHRFEDLAEKVGLPWIDKDTYRRELLSTARITELPRIRKLNEILEKQWELSLEIRSAIGERENLRYRLYHETCALRDDASSNGGASPSHKSQQQQGGRVVGFDQSVEDLGTTSRPGQNRSKRGSFRTSAAAGSSGGAAPTDDSFLLAHSGIEMGPNGEIKCSVASHRHCAELLQKMDEVTDRVLRLIRQWRKQLNRPQPFFVKQQNYLLQLAKDCNMNGLYPLASSHMRGTSRHLNFFYASTYDAVAASSMNIIRPELEYLLIEAKRQKELCEEQLTLANMGVYMPVIKFQAFTKSRNNGEGLIHINKKPWKEQLIVSYSSALQLVNKQIASGATTSGETTQAATQFLFFSSRAMHIRYFRRWVEWLIERQQRKARVEVFLAQTKGLSMQRRYFTWKRRMEISRSNKQKTGKLEYQNEDTLRRRYMSKWFVQSRLESVGRAARRGVYLKYYESFFYLVFLKRLKQQTIPGVTSSDSLRSLHIVSLMAPKSTTLPMVRSTHTSLRPFLFVGQQETARRQKIFEEETKGILILMSEIYLSIYTFVRQEATPFDDPFLAETVPLHESLLRRSQEEEEEEEEEEDNNNPAATEEEEYNATEKKRHKKVILSSSSSSSPPGEGYNGKVIGTLLRYNSEEEGGHQKQVSFFLQQQVISEEEKARAVVLDFWEYELGVLWHQFTRNLQSTLQRLESRQRKVVQEGYLQFVKDSFELLNMSYLVAQRRSLQARELRSRRGFMRRFQLGLADLNTCNNNNKTKKESDDDGVQQQAQLSLSSQQQEAVVTIQGHVRSNSALEEVRLKRKESSSVNNRNGGAEEVEEEEEEEEEAKPDEDNGSSSSQAVNNPDEISEIIPSRGAANDDGSLQQEEESSYTNEEFEE